MMKPNLDKLREVVARNNFLIFDTETTGLGSDAEIVQLAAIHSGNGDVLNTLVRPTRPIPPDASNVHHITTEQAERDGLKWRTVFYFLMDLLELNQCDVVSYNLAYDSRLVVQTCKAHSIDSAPWLEYLHKRPGVCAMLAYAEQFGQWDSKHGNYKWQPLSRAALNEKIEVKDAHDAMGDCKMTAALCQKLAKELTDEPAVPALAP